MLFLGIFAHLRKYWHVFPVVGTIFVLCFALANYTSMNIYLKKKKIYWSTNHSERTNQSEFEFYILLCLLQKHCLSVHDDGIGRVIRLNVTCFVEFVRRSLPPNFEAAHYSTEILSYYIYVRLVSFRRLTIDTDCGCIYSVEREICNSFYGSILIHILRVWYTRTHKLCVHILAAHIYDIYIDGTVYTCGSASSELA